MPDYPNLFENSDPLCNVTPVDKVDFDFIEACDIAQLPEPIYECPLPEILPEPDTEVGLKCPVFNAVTTTIDVGYSGTNRGGVRCVPNDIPTMSIGLTRSTKDPCTYDIDLNVNIPLPPPPCQTSLVEGDVNLTVAYDDCVTSNGTLTIQPQTILSEDCEIPDTCEFTIGLNLDIGIPRPPCPVFTVSDFSVDSGYTTDGCTTGVNKFTIEPRVIPGDCDTPERCEFLCDLKIFVPIPKQPCPEITVRTFTVGSKFNDDPTNCPLNNRFTITPVPVPGTCDIPDSCNFICDLEILVPIPRTPCPVIGVGDFAVSVGYAGSDCVTGTNAFRVRKNIVEGDCDNPPTCEFLFDLSVVVPIPKPPCVTLTNKTPDDFVRVYYNNTPGCAPQTPTFIITPRYTPGDGCNEPDRCEWIIALDLPIAIPRPACPIIDIRTFNVDSGYVSAACPAGTNRFVITPRVTAGGCATPDQCEFLIDLEIFVPIPKQPCPAINVRTFTVGSKFNDDPTNCPLNNRFTITPVPVPGNCDVPDSCNFLVDLEILVPIPRTPCPVIDVGVFDVSVGYAGSDCVAGENFFRIRKNIVDGDCDNPAYCEFLFDVNIVVPIPKPPCVTLVNNTQEDFVTVYYDDPLSDCPPCRKPTFSITPTYYPGDGCNEPDRCEWAFEVDLPICLPKPPCPIIRIGDFSVTAVYDTPSCLVNVPQNRFTCGGPFIVRGDCNTPDQCEYVIDLDIRVPIPKPPCPVFTVTRLDVKSRYNDNPQQCSTGSTLTISPHPILGDCDTPDQCRFDVVVDILVPIPRPPCPIINRKVFKVVTGFSDNSCVQHPNVFTITPHHTSGTCDTPGQCRFDIDLEIYVPIPRPPCVTLTNKTPDDFVSVTYSDCSVPDPVFIIRPVIDNGDGCRTQAKCEWEFELQLPIKIPRTPCPEFNTTSSLSVGYSDCTESKFVFDIVPRARETNCTGDGPCIFDVVLEIGVPIPRPPCVDIYVDNFNVNVVYDRPACVEDKPQNRFEITPEHVPGDCNTPDQCRFKVDLDILVPIPEPPCVVINQNSAEEFVKIGYAGSTCVKNKQSKFAITQKITQEEIDCRTVSKCEWDVELEIVVPIPVPPCVTLTNAASTEFVKVGYSDCPTVKDKKSKFTITPTGAAAGPKGSSSPLDCDTPKECSWEFDIEIYVPIPRPPCVTITKKDKPVVLVGFSGCPSLKDPATNQQKQSVFTITQVEPEPTNSCTETSKCEWEVDLQIVVPIPKVPCPEIKFTGTTFARARYEDSVIPFAGSRGDFYISQTQSRPNNCDPSQPNVCTTNIDVEIDIPVPRVPCVTLAPRNKRLTVTIDDRPSELKFEIVENHNQNYGTNKPPECSFDIDLEIDIRLPPFSVCPVMRQGNVVIRKINPEVLQYRDPRFKMMPRVECIPGIKTFIYFDFDIEVPFCVYRFKYDNIGTKSGGPAQGNAIKKLYYNPEKAEPPTDDARADMLKMHIKQNPKEKCEWNFSSEVRINIPSVYYDFPEAKIKNGCTGVTGAAGDVGSSGQYGQSGASGATGCARRPTGSFSPINRIWFDEPTGPSGSDTGKSDPIKVTKQLNVAANQLIAGEVTIRPAGIGCGRFMIEEDPTCRTNKKLNLEIDLETTSCPSDGGLSPGGAGTGSGISGPTGPTGVIGETGPTGPSGSRGEKGATGIQGATGATIEVRSGYNSLGFPQLIFDDFYFDLPDGPTGASGPSGPSGPKGPSGLQGFMGLTGPSGPSGPSGPTGPKGPTGSTGPTGPTGPSGPAGSTGPTGPAGLNFLGNYDETFQYKKGDAVCFFDQVGSVYVSIADPPGPGYTDFEYWALLIEAPLGPSGPAGPRGITGPRGATGPVGPVGARGERGAIGSQGQRGVTGVTGATGPVGPAGQRGDAGPTGSTGPIGITGPSGPAGATGADGATGLGEQGSTGPDGPTGAVGPTGPTGGAGTTGPIGPRGSTGPEGPTGEQGCPGATGLIGPSGNIGSTGPRGERGSTGPAGQSGALGLTGPRGPTGANGPTGPQGATGSTGSAGIIGPSGAAGPTGVSGPTGATGSTGPKGATGISGDKGDRGSTGPIGPSGALGLTGPRGPTGVNGPTGIQGATGPAGISGATGASGPVGASGPSGAQGPAGLVGPVGDRGQKGEKGDRGLSGPQGPAGATGLTGTTGPKGATGIVGGTGPTGPYGPCGPPGTPGPQGATGPAGPSGPAGPATLTAELLAQIINAVQTNETLRAAILDVLNT